MSEPNAFERILSRLDEADGVSEKTASAEADAPTSEALMLNAVRRISDSNQKTASANVETPAETLATMAEKTAAAEQEELLKVAHGMGAIICDGFFERFAAYDSALNKAGIKQASASIDENTIKQAMENGYKQAQADMEKQAQESFEQGYQDTLQAVYKTAAEIHYQGQLVAQSLLKEAAAQNS